MRLFMAVAAVMCIVVTARAETVDTTVTVKSFIKKIDTTSVMECSGTMEKLFATLANCQFHEDPKTPNKDGSYRLRSELAVTAECSSGIVKTWRLATPTSVFGKEAWLLAAEGRFETPILRAIPAATGSNSRKVSFEYLLQGRPNAATEPAFAAVRPRSCQYIWHRVLGTLACSGAKPVITVFLQGSQFPSHRAWVGATVSGEQEQGPLSALWVCDPTAPLRIK